MAYSERACTHEHVVEVMGQACSSGGFRIWEGGRAQSVCVCGGGGSTSTAARGWLCRSNIHTQVIKTIHYKYIGMEGGGEVGGGGGEGEDSRICSEEFICFFILRREHNGVDMLYL